MSSSKSTDTHTTWYEPTVLSSSLSEQLVKLSLLSGVSLIAAAFDVVVIKPTIDRTMHLSDPLSWAVSVSLALASAVVMFLAGMTWRSETGREEPHRLSVVLLAGWVSLGATVVLMRIVSADAASGATGFAGSVMSSGESEREHALAFVLIGLYALSGALAFFDGHHFNPVAIAYLRASRSLEDLRFKITAQYGTVRRAASDLARSRIAFEQVETAYVSALSSHAHVAAELMAEARILIANRIAASEATGITARAPESKHFTDWKSL